MERHYDLFEEIVRMRAAGEPAALCTVLVTRGSTPGKETMRMLVRGDGTHIGTVGGGCVEADVIKMALEVLEKGRAQSQSFTLNQSDLPESGLICGGQLTILAEPIVSPVLVLFGGGHVAEATAQVAKHCDLRVEVCDDREEYASSDRHPAADVHRHGAWRDLVKAIAPAENHFVVVATRGHKDDLEVLRALHSEGCAPRYLGLLGSKAKQADLRRALQAEGASEAFLDSIRTPIGLPIGSRTPGEIAVSLMAELVALKNLGNLDDRAR
ncbi:MAG: XdhC/CoxI family protein [Planctomycetes bacterium]|nr:XdhC/CoxI family protein [Planctomycetota bacterium]